MENKIICKQEDMEKGKFSFTFDQTRNKSYMLNFRLLIKLGIQVFLVLGVSIL